MAVEWFIAGLGASAAAGAWWSRRLRSTDASLRIGPDWAECFTSAGLGPVTSAGRAELRVQGPRARWTIAAERASSSVSDLVVESDRIEFDGRLYVGWNTPPPPPAIAAWPRAEGAEANRPPDGLVVRCDDSFDARAWLEAHEVHLVDLRLQTDASGLQLTISGGYAKLRLFDARAARGALPRIVEATDPLPPLPGSVGIDAQSVGSG